MQTEANLSKSHGLQRHTTREAWLNDLAQRMRPMFDRAGAALPKKFRLTMSLTKGAKAIGTCFDASASKDESYEILIRLDREEPIDVATILAHELTHAAVGIDAGHGPKFGRVARALGLEGKLTATTPGPRFVDDVKPLLAAVGAFPHARLDFGAKRTGPKSQTARMIKVECKTCGLVARMARKWIDDVGVVHCPEHGPMVEDDGDDDEPPPVH